MKIISSLFNSYSDYYKYADYRLKYVGIIGVIAFPLFYFLPSSIFQNYENPYPRIIATILCLLLAIYEKWPKNCKRYFLYYSYFALIYCLPFFHTYTTITITGRVFIWDISMSLFLVCLLFDWRNAIIVYIIGGFAAIILHYLLTKASISINYTKNLPEFILIIIGSSLFRYSSDIIEQEKSKTLKSLAASIAHEMRNPLNSIISAIGYIKMSLPTRPIGNFNCVHQISTKNLIEIYDAIDQSDLTIKRGNKIIDSILSNMQGKDVDIGKFVSVLASKVVKEAIDSFGYSEISDRDFIHISLVNDFRFFGDQDLFIYVLFNLIKNSLCYKNKPNFKIEITITAEQDRNVIKVKDYGPGIAKEKITEIFESFITAGKEDGTGLGLAFCKRVMNSFKGDISCESEFGKSTEFSLIFPSYDSKIINEIKAKVLKQKKILIVDDEDLSRLLIKKVVVDLVAVADEAKNGLEALKRIANNQYDLIFMDIEMPEMNGYEAAKNIRDPHSEFISQELVINYQKVPIIAVTSLAKRVAKQRALFFGMSDFVVKPINKEIILDLLSKWFFTSNDLVVSNLAVLTKGKVILIVDDENVNLKYSAKILENFDFKVKTAMNGEKAIEILDQENCDLILMDINMPVLDGYKATKLIRKGDSFKNFDNFKIIPIIGLSGDNSQEIIKKSKESGMNDLICKPILPETLVEIISKWLA
jgi:two-component system CAI-1 autoinducer sensor kinase/phosphatase CqsS